MNRQPENDDHWQDLANEWDLRPGTCYLNHGSFGVSPRVVRQARRDWIDQLDQQPMDFYLRRFEDEFQQTRRRLAEFIGTQPDNLVFGENATYGMNVVANSFELTAGDEVLITDHEYGAVKRIWERKCERTGAKLITCPVSIPFCAADQIVEEIASRLTERTRMVVVSHVTSQTGTLFPVEKICDRLADHPAAVCVDGPHAPAQFSVNLDELGCDFYTASCHKWLCAPLGSGFLFAAPHWHSRVQALNLSWGRLSPNQPERWDEEFIWMGTRDPSSFLAIRTAIDFMESVGLDDFRARTHWLAHQALQELQDLFQTEPLYPFNKNETCSWFGSMCEIPLPENLPDSDRETLQQRLWDNHGIEVPVFEFGRHKLLRVSFHLYNSQSDIRKLKQALIAERAVG